MADDRLTTQYDVFYRDRDPVAVYPVEFVVRAFLGNYPRHRTSKDDYPGWRILDLGFGDGRNMPLLRNLGMRVFGVEISQRICELTEERMKRLGIEVETRVGRNNHISFESRFFDAVLACHACYYVDAGSSFSDNVKEIARVLKPNGRFVFSAPMASSYIMRGAEDLGDGHMRIANDPYGVRNGAILKKFDREQDIAGALSPLFGEFSIGSCRNDFWGIEEYVWIVTCRRTSQDEADR
jgi:SAM-dependent methyltransferase